MNEIVFLNGNYVPLSEAKIHVNDRGFHFGDGLYDIMLICNGVIVDFDWHFDRMQRTAQRMYVNLDYSRENLLQIGTELIARNAVNEGRFIIVLSRGSADRWDVNFEAMKQNFFVQTQAYNCGIGKGEIKNIKLKSYEDIRWKFKDIKVTSLLPSVILRHEAGQDGFDDVLYYGEEGKKVYETSRGNIFMVQGNTVITPPLSKELLPGITRARLLELIRDQDLIRTLSPSSCKLLSEINLREENFDLDMLKNADEVFSTSATARVVWVSQIDDKKFLSSKISSAMLELYDAYILKMGGFDGKKLT